jgi:hypothetical protein
MPDSIVPEQSPSVGFLEDQHQWLMDAQEALKYMDRWMQVIRDELQRMREEGVDPHIAWLSIYLTTDSWEECSRLHELKPKSPEPL